MIGQFCRPYKGIDGIGELMAVAGFVEDTQVPPNLPGKGALVDGTAKGIQGITILQYHKIIWSQKIPHLFDPIVQHSNAVPNGGILRVLVDGLLVGFIGP